MNCLARAGVDDANSNRQLSVLRMALGPLIHPSLTLPVEGEGTGRRDDWLRQPLSNVLTRVLRVGAAELRLWWLADDALEAELVAVGVGEL